MPKASPKARKEYDPKVLEPKWQKSWEKSKIFQAKGPSKSKNKSEGESDASKKFYSLIEFPYPSGDGLHVGHVRSNTAMDIISHKRRREGYDVIFPIGWDAFGLPAENYAIKVGIDPAITTKKNAATFRRQLKSIGFSFDWSREIDTTDPKYYKWTQWIFLQFLKKGLAYKKKMYINWCPKDLIGLANEEVVDGKCERCGTVVEKREKEQWMLAITKYAERLDKDLDDVDYLEKIKIQQRNWIGKSEGAELDFEFKGAENKKIKVYTTRPDTLFGVTYIVLAPEHEFIKELVMTGKANEALKKYIADARAKSDIDRTDAKASKTGVILEGVKAINPINKEEVPVYVADYVLAEYGTGAVMAVPAHDERDYAFAQKYNLPIKQVLASEANDDEAYIGEGVLIHSEQFTGLHSADAKKNITEAAGGKWVKKFKLRDWVFSRQRYWGEPIPVVHCEKCGIVPVPESQLPVKLPKVKNYKPTETGESPLASISKWVNTKCPQCKAKAKRETDTMPNWAGSSWYYLRYTDPKNSKAFASPQALKYFTPVDWYNGGMEHTTLHLLYSRFWHKFLFDIGVVPTSEPYQKRTSNGLILAQDGEKMSKSRGNVVNPDSIVSTLGADTLRLYEMFAGPFDQNFAWDVNGIAGPRRFIERVWKLNAKVVSNVKGGVNVNADLTSLVHKTIKKVSDDIEGMRFNTAISALMILVNEMEKEGEKKSEKMNGEGGEAGIDQENYELLLKLLAPFAPHVTEELWSLRNKGSIHLTAWPQPDPQKIKQNKAQIIVQVNGKHRATLTLDSTENGELDEENVKEKALKLDEVSKWMYSAEIIKVVYVRGRLINFVINLTSIQQNDKK